MRRRQLCKFIFLGLGTSKIICWGVKTYLLRRRRLCRFISLGFGASKIICWVVKNHFLRRRRLSRLIFWGFWASKIICWGVTNNYLRRRRVCRFICLGFGASEIICWGVKNHFGGNTGSRPQLSVTIFGTPRVQTPRANPTLVLYCTLSFISFEIIVMVITVKHNLCFLPEQSLTNAPERAWFAGGGGPSKSSK